MRHSSIDDVEHGARAPPDDFTGSSGPPTLRPPKGDDCKFRMLVTGTRVFTVMFLSQSRYVAGHRLTGQKTIELGSPFCCREQFQNKTNEQERHLILVSGKSEAGTTETKKELMSHDS